MKPLKIKGPFHTVKSMGAKKARIYGVTYDVVDPELGKSRGSVYTTNNYQNWRSARAEAVGFINGCAHVLGIKKPPLRNFFTLFNRDPKLRKLGKR